ncbi:LuxR C-terminal-related transcriptional regulator [Actinoplanes sp. TRM 88003]|uniref:LuxR C-terminal-related transcriptional regulator n=2 Tax=Paractinoplanes aksuensis TaxID=2939490 RepID=A0ABT1DU78_9ACTN|nr:LuxR C-terminal-related transcriptional regulator [Actinoplanes aksuensis]
MIAALRLGESRVLVLRGAAGIGKSALLAHAEVRANGFRMLRAAGVESEMELAFAGLHQLCAPLFDRLPSLPPPQRAALETVFRLREGAPPDNFLVGLAVLGLFADASAKEPLLCLVDDAQWLDRASAQVIGFVARRLLAESVALILATRRTGPELIGLPELEVAGLAEPDAHTLLNAVTLTRLDRHISDRIVAETGGNPLALVELTRGLTATQMAGGLGLTDAGTLPGRIEDSFLHRIQELPAASRRLLLIAAAEPVGDPGLVRRAADRLDVPFPAAADDTDGLLSLAERVTFRHPLVRSAVYRAAEPHDRRAAHLALAEVTDRPDAADRRAWHLAAAAAGPDEEVAAELERSAAQAQARGGMAAAAAFLRRAVVLTADPRRRTDRLLAAAEACLPAGDVDEVRRLLKVLGEQQLDELAAGRVMALRGQVAFASGHGHEATELLLASAQRLAAADDQLARDVLMPAWGVATSVAQPESLRAVSFAARALPAPADPRPIDLLLDGLTLLVTDGRAVAAPALREAAKILLDISVDDVVKWGWVAAGVAGAVWDDDAMRDMYARHVRLIREAGVLTDLPYHLATLCLITSWSGDFPAAAALIAEADTVSQAIGSPMPPYPQLRLLSLQGREAEAAEIIGTTITNSLAAGFGLGLIAANWAAAVLYNGLARYPEALRAIRANGDLFDANLSAWVLPELVEAAVRAGESEVALDALARLVEETQPFGTPFARGIEARTRALVAEGADADDLYRQAIEKLGRTNLRPELARAHLVYGEWLRRERRRADAREHLRTAYDLFVAIGMEGFAERARRELIATGETVRRRTAAAAADVELTAQERQIAQLVRSGLTNPEVGARLFLSPRTVEWHLRKVFGKLGVTSRRQLRDALPRTISGDAVGLIGPQG